MKTTKTQSINHAVSRVCGLYPIGTGNYNYTTWSPYHAAWVESYPQTYQAARANMAQARIDHARDLLGLSYVSYAGGPWRSYVSF
jgi:hypothetical protein